jgi:hypothetical protein
MSNTPASIGIDEEGMCQNRQIESRPVGSPGNVRLIEAIERTRFGSLSARRRTVA